MRWTIVCVLCWCGAVLQSCDRIDESMIEKPAHTGPVNDTSGAPATVLLEYFTGHYCGNCPGSSNPAIAELQRLYGDRVVVMTIHAGFFATPNLTPDKLDLTSGDGNALYQSAGVTGVPVGRVDRRTVNGMTLLPPSSWSTAVGAIIDTPSSFGLTVTAQYDSSSRSGTVGCRIRIYGAVADSLYMEAYVLEDSIRGYQLDFTKNPDLVPGYVFNHVLRGALVASGGALLTSGNTAGDTVMNRTFSLQLKPAWNERRCSVVAVVRDAATGEITQAATVPVIQR